jgi:hypothetical protein
MTKGIQAIMKTKQNTTTLEMLVFFLTSVVGGPERSSLLSDKLRVASNKILLPQAGVSWLVTKRREPPVKTL